jgi:16S rRNA (guanine(966)-N(2))-methyltransferase RsmD
LDLFAGTGALGIEALSRGYQHAVFVESNREAYLLTEENIRRCQLEDRARVVKMDVFRYLESEIEDTFDLVLFDPPYDKNLAIKTLNRLASWSGLSDDCHLVCEAERDVELPEVVGNLARLKHRLYGGTSVHIYSIG